MSEEYNMSFPINDKYWKNTADFISCYVQEEETIIAPTEFKEIFGEKIIGYPTQNIVKSDIYWMIIHKGMIKDIDPVLIEYVDRYLIPVYANEVFVIFSNNKELPRVNSTSPHIQSYWKMSKRYYVSLLKKLKTKIILKYKNLFSKDDIERSIDMDNKIFIRTMLDNIIALIRSKSHREYAYLGDYKALTRTIFGHKIFLDTRDISLCPHIILDGNWEMWITNVFTNLVKDGMNIVEIGTNIGYYSVIFASKIGESGKLFAFEANPRIFEMLHQTVEINGFLNRVELVNKAVTDSSGKISFSILKRHHGSGSIVTFSEEHLERSREEVEIINVDTISLDEYFNNRDIKIDVIKIDAEGSEPYIFDGMRKLIEDNHDIIIICEFNPALISGARKDPRKFLEQIEQYEFPLRYIDNNSNIVDTSVEELMKKDICDLYLKR